ncbi:MAG: hypothetical protein E3J35_01165 [Methanomassiliicoccales archaeon]|nr:MAG: hypothetical protein E3J35_01165 [Methanomassiliicoccales archaeon]
MSSARARAIRTLSTVGIALLMVWSTVSIFSVATTEKRTMYLVSLEKDASTEVFGMIGTNVLVDYGNGMYIVDATESELFAMEGYNLNVIPSGSYRTVDLYPYDIVFDATESVPAAPSVMDGFGWDRETYIVQFIGPYTPNWLETIEDMGARVGKLAQRYSAIVKMSPNVESRVSELPYVAWVGAYQPWYKISSDVLNTEGGLRVEIMAFEDSMRDSLSTKLVDLGASVITTYSPGFIVAYLDSRLLPWVISMPEVMEVYRTSIPKTQDIMAAKIMGAFDSWDTAGSGLPSTLTGRSPGPDGLDYTADDIYEVIGIQDSGFDVGNPDAGHPDFFMGPVGDRVIRYLDRTGRSDPDGMQSGTAHGTHVAGDAIGNGFCWENVYGYPTNDANWDNSEGVGMAPEAKLSMDGVQGLGGLWADPDYWDTQYSDGAHVYSNSYGRDPGPYSGSSAAADMKTAAENNRLIVFAASNEGPDLNTLGPGSQAKNGITAGASLNFRPDWFEADNPNIMADFSSRGGPGQSLGRLKPDMVSVGTASIAPMGVGEWERNVLIGVSNPQPDYIMTVDCYNQDNPTALDGDGINDYRYMGGTSVASPHMAGLALLVREYLREYAGYSDPYAINSQLVKGLMINGAVRMDEALYEYPGYDQGWGRVNLINSLFPPVPRTNRWEEGTMAAPGSWLPSFTTSVQSDEVPLKITLTWVDQWGEDLFRDIDLLVRSPSGDVYKGNVYGIVGQFDGWSKPNPIASDANPLWDRYLSDAFDDLNNVEQVEVQFPEVGTWQIEVIGRSIPASTPFALVVAADIGPQDEYKIDLDSDYPLSIEITKGGEVFFPFKVTNFGTNTDNVFITGTSPPLITMNFEKVLITDLEPRETVTTWVRIVVDQNFPSCGIQDLRITGTSMGDTSVTDRLELELAVSCDVVVTPIQLTTDLVDELDPSVLTFNNGTADHIFIAYRNTTKVAVGGLYGGPNVYVAHTTLDAQGMPVLPFKFTVVSNWNDDPNDIRMTYIPRGNYTNRVIITWTGSDPNASVPDLDSYGVLSYSDPPYDTWNRVVIERNAGGSLMNEARVNIPLWRDDGTPGGEVIWVWEHLDYATVDGGNPLYVQTWVAISRDGGETWPDCRFGTDPDCRRISPSVPGNYYFFPNACIDTREVLWVFFYYRSTTGNDRDLMVRLYDNDGWQGDDTPWPVTADDVSLLWNTLNTNVQWPACVATSEGPANNRMYVVVTNDEGQVDLRLYVAYLDGHYTSTEPPFGLNTTDLEGISPNLHGPFGPFGKSVSNSNYNRRPILNMVSTGDGFTWIQYIEKANEFNEPNLWTYNSDDGFATPPSLSKLTADPFAKGHQMTDALTVSGIYHNVYEVFHASKGTETDVNYDVYLLIYHKDWESDPDTVGPMVDPIVGYPNPFDVSIDGAELAIYATVSDVSTGMSNVTAAEWKEVPLNVTDPRLINWTGALPMAIGSDSPTEVGEATHTPTTWDGGETHKICARGQDEYNNWGIGACVNVLTIGQKPEFVWFNLTFASAGWYLISFPVSLTDKSVQNTFSSINNSYDQVRVYDTQTSQWLSYMTFKSVQTLTEVDKTMGIWIHMTGPASLNMSGLVSYITEIELYPGWNLIGYPSMNSTGMMVSDLLNYSVVDAVEGFDGMNPPYHLRQMTNPNEYLVPGEGYWVHVNGSPVRIPIPGF